MTEWQHILDWWHALKDIRAEGDIKALDEWKPLLLTIRRALLMVVHAIERMFDIPHHSD